MKRTDIEGRGTIVKTARRVRIVLTAFFLFMVFLISNLMKLQIGLNAYYTDKVYDQITTTSALHAQRGTIYDSNMNILATSNTAWRIFISTKDIKMATRERGKDYAKIVAYGLADILSLDREALLKKISGSSVLDVTVKKTATEEEFEKVLRFTIENSLEDLIFTEAQSSRYYPGGTLASHLLGFTGSDGQGLYGLEYYYNSYLSGTDGSYQYAKDANGNALSTEYSSYTPATNGHSIVTTIDSYVQEILESQLAQVVEAHGVTNRATGIVMDVQTGAILAMATSSPFDSNSPYTLDELSMSQLDSSGYAKNSEEYKAYKKELLEIMWSNKAISEVYEPGSTFKIVTVSTALELGVVDTKDTFSCHGYHTVGGWKIKCHKIGGHGSGFSLAYGLQMSCNPTMMQIAERIGASDFYSYVESFGYLQKTGIDLPSEANSIFHNKEAIGSTELATISFGQRFKVSIINHLTAICAVANGGELVTPYVVKRIMDENGSVIFERESEIKRRVISEEVASTVSKILADGVSGDGGAKNARVDGYVIAAKTGTSEKFDVLDANGNSYLRIASTVAYNLSENGGIATIIVVDEPQGSVKYGSVVAAPYVSALLMQILPYLGYESDKVNEEISVPDLVGRTVRSATEELDKLGLKYEIIGDGDLVISQSPTHYDTISNVGSTVILYTNKDTCFVTVPSFIGKEISVAVNECADLGLNIKLRGSIDGGNVVAQSLPVGAVVERGSVIELTATVTDFED